MVIVSIDNYIGIPVTQITYASVQYHLMVDQHLTSLQNVSERKREENAQLN